MKEVLGIMNGSLKPNDIVQSTESDASESKPNKYFKGIKSKPLMQKGVKNEK